jgi:hypothetical protein
MRGMAFIPDKSEPDIARENDAKTLHMGELTRHNFEMGDTLTLSTMLGILISTYVNVHLFHTKNLN